jgi:hypothetical protein
MKNWSTLLFIVKKVKGKSYLLTEKNPADFFTEPDKTPFSPSAHSIRKIMDFASSYKVMDCNSTGQIEMIIN